MTSKVALTERFERALLFASRAHQGQVRKGSAVPYLAHLLAVCALVLEQGGDEDQAIAALLHDCPEDQGGRDMLERIRTELGSRSAELVAGCGEPLDLHGAPWQQRKEAFLAQLVQAPPAVLLVVAADKCHNLTSLLEEHARSGDEVFERFGGKKAGTLWYYDSLTRLLAPRIPPLLGERLLELNTRLGRLG
jgi:(p)ppGpp synthase/HD superfamily hydrolase